ncbi:MAG: peptide chain release factor 3 [Thermoleophilia bacterium]|nr:peptide chain release factor 3 [Thermoleophilia bacterium]
MATADDIRSHARTRRTVAIISHPDAGKTTLTEALLKVTDTIGRAGTVHTRGNSERRATVTDWMDIEKERGISVASSAVRIQTQGHVVNLLDTPGHGDFSEDTYRVLSAVDSAVMLLDAGKGIEPQTRRLFEVCRARALPIITFVNKIDRPAMDAMEMLDHVEAELDLHVMPLMWPAGDAAAIQGVVHRGDALGVSDVQERAPWEARGFQEHEWQEALDNLELAQGAAGGFDREAFEAGDQTPMLFGSAASMFGIDHLVAVLRDLAPAPAARTDRHGAPREIEEPFSAHVFKLQANVDQRHRDVAAYMRICSGAFTRGDKVTIARTGRPLVVSRAVEPFGQDRETVEEAWPGDVIVLPGSRDLRIGDTLHAGKVVEFPPITTFTPHLFRQVSNRDISRRKQFQQGLQQLGDEGVVQIYMDPKVGMQTPICAAVGQLQYEVFLHRMQNEFGVQIGLSDLPLQVSVAWSETNEGDPPRAAGMRVLESTHGVRLLAFGTEWALANYRKDHPDLVLNDVL